MIVIFYNNIFNATVAEFVDQDKTNGNSTNSLPEIIKLLDAYLDVDSFSYTWLQQQWELCSGSYRKQHNTD